MAACNDAICWVIESWQAAGPSESNDVSEVMTGKRKRKTIDYKVGL